MKIVILAAGQGTRIKSFSLKTPKTLIRVDGKSILEHQIDVFLKAGCKESDIYVVTGYLNEQIEALLKVKYKKVKTVINKEYSHTNNMYSLWLGLKQIRSYSEPCFVSNGDNIYTLSTIQEALKSPKENSVTYIPKVVEEAMNIYLCENNVYLKNLTKDVGSNTAGISLDIYTISSSLQESLIKTMEDHFKTFGKKDWMEVAFVKTHEKKFEAIQAPINYRCEIDNMEDLLCSDEVCNSFSKDSKKALVFDIDGTLFLGNKPIEPAINFLKSHKNQFEYYFLSNNTSTLPSSIQKKLENQNLFFDLKFFINPLESLKKLITSESLHNIFVMANSKVTDYLKKELPDHFKLNCTNPEVCQALVITYDTELTYEKLKQAAILLNQNPNLKFITTHSDLFCPSSEGPLPDTGSFLALFKKTTGRSPDTDLGKPNSILIDSIIQKYKPEEIAIVGDRLYTDGLLAQNVGCDFVCVLSGETKRVDLQNVTHFPQLVLKDLGRWDHAL